MAEDIREEARAKISIIGALLGDDIIFSDDAPASANFMYKLCFLIIFRDGDGTWATNWRIEDEAGELMARAPKEFEMTKKPGVNHSMSINATMKFLRYGRFTVTATLDDHEYPFKFGAWRGKLHQT